MNPVVSRLDKQREKELKKELIRHQFEPMGERNALLDADFSDGDDDAAGVKSRKRSFQDDESSSDEDETLRTELKQQYKLIREERMKQRRLERQQERAEPRLLALKPGHKFQGLLAPGQAPKKKMARFEFDPDPETEVFVD